MPDVRQSSNRGNYAGHAVVWLCLLRSMRVREAGGSWERSLAWQLSCSRRLWAANCVRNALQQPC
jgi:hypothetical protein